MAIGGCKEKYKGINTCLSLDTLVLNCINLLHCFGVGKSACLPIYSFIQYSLFLQSSTRGRIEESVQFLKEEIKEFQSDYSIKALRDYQEDKKLQKLMDRTVENIFTALIEVCGAVLSEERIRAENYGEVLEKCGKFMGLSEDEQKNVSGLAIQRNRLAHRYLNFRWQAIN